MNLPTRTRRRPALSTTLRSGTPVGDQRPRKMRLALAMEQVVGHAVQATHMRRHITEYDDVDARFIPVTFFERKGLIERLAVVPAYLRASLRARLEVRRGLDGWRPDGIFWNTQKPALLCPDLLRTHPSVISLDVTPKQYDDLGESYGHAPDGAGPVAYAKHWANRQVFRLAKRLVPATEWVRRSLIDDYDVSPERIEVVPPGTDTVRFRPPSRRPSDVDGKMRILFVGGDFARKGGDTLLDWFLTSPTAEQCILHIVTREAIRATPRIMVHSLSHEQDQLTNLFREADVFVLPTRADCFGLVLTEAMASGLPVVSCPVGGITEVVREGETGLLVRPDSASALEPAMSALLEDGSLRSRLGSRGREVAEQRFDAGKNVARIVTMMRAVVEAPSSGNGA